MLPLSLSILSMALLKEGAPALQQPYLASVCFGVTAIAMLLVNAKIVFPIFLFVVRDKLVVNDPYQPSPLDSIFNSLILGVILLSTTLLTIGFVLLMAVMFFACFELGLRFNAWLCWVFFTVGGAISATGLIIIFKDRHWRFPALVHE